MESVIDDITGGESILLTKDNEFVESGKRKNVGIEEALQCTDFGKYNVYLIFLCGICLFAANIESYSIGYILPAAECDLNLNASKKGILSSATFFGIMISSVFWGYLSDRKGRKKLLLITLALSFVSSAAAPLTSSFWGFTFLRFFTGICISAPSSIIFAYFGEFQSEKNRSKGIAFISIFISLVLIYLPSFAWAILPKIFTIKMFGTTLNSWRLFMFLNAFPNLISAVLFTFLPESPKFLYHNGQLEEARRVLKLMYETNTGRHDFPVDGLDKNTSEELKNNEKVNMLVEMKNQILGLFQPPSLKYTIAGCVLQAGIYAISCGLFLWYPDIINQLSNNKDENLTVCKALSLSVNKTTSVTCDSHLNNDIFIQNIIIGFCLMAGYLSWGTLEKLLGNRNFFVVSMVISSFGILLLCFISNKLLIDITFNIILTIPATCIALVCAIIVDVIPSQFCGMAICLTLTGGRLGSILTSTFVGILLQTNCTATFMSFIVLLLVCLATAFVFPKK